MERIQVTIIQEKMDTDGTISVTASRNGQNCLNEVFSSKNLDDHPLHTLSAERIEGTESAENCVSANLLWNILSDVCHSEKTSSKALYGQTESKFALTSLLDIKRFEMLSGIKFDYSKFSSLQEFQRYFKSLIK